VQIAIVSDTHMPRRGRALPAECVDRLRRADLILHAGDLISLDMLEELQGYGPTVAVRGNVDDTAVKAALPECELVLVEGHRIALVHDAGAERGRLERLRGRFPNADVVVFGHSHLPLHEVSRDGFQIFNPGSPTERRRARTRSMGIATVANCRLTFELLALG